MSRLRWGLTFAMIGMLGFLASGSTASARVVGGALQIASAAPEQGSCANAAPGPRLPFPNSDDELLDIGLAVPGFGGMVKDPHTNSLTVFLLNPSDESAQLAALQEVTRARGTSNQGVRFVQGQYAMTQLRGWSDCLRQFDISGVVIRGIDEAANRLWFGVVDEASVEKARTRVSELGVPVEAIAIEVTGRVKPNTLLTDNVRPLIGGIQVKRLGAGTECTLGFNVVRSGEYGFVTNSHCSWYLWNTDTDKFYQPAPTDEVGVEGHDPIGFSGGSCDNGWTCRWSDSTFVKKNADVTMYLGHIAKTTSGTTIDPNADYRITSEDSYPDQDDSVTKVGRSTGTTSGTVYQTCMIVDYTANKRYLCQDLATYSSQGGDSGSPVFYISNNPNTNDVELKGIHWGRTDNGAYAIFSAMGNIQATGELGSLTNCATGYSC